MAVELAKVSLWLDAFTIGAPLNFLDHHLRPGNALIGLSCRDLENALARRPLLIGKVRERLRIAIEGMLQIIRATDATAKETKESAAAYESLRERLSGAHLALDLLTSKIFGVTGASELIEDGFELDLSTRDAFLASLHDEAERVIVGQAEALSRDRLLHFLAWDLEFPEVFFGTAPADFERLRQGGRLSATDKGFDCVVGNPPYVRMELIKPQKPFLKSRYRCHADRADLFIYFYERAVNLLRPGGRTAFIASSTWTKTKAGEGLREFLKEVTSLDSFLDFGDLPVFEDATTYPCILVASRQKPPAEQIVASAVVRDLGETDLNRYLHSNTVSVPQSELETGGWHFEDRMGARLRDKIRRAGVPLKEYCGSPLYGIKTGLNDAFVIDTPRRDQLVAEDRKSAEILKPFLEGKDLKAWRTNWRGLWLIYTHHGIDIERYPVVREYLRTFKPQLERRATSANHEWYELQQPQLAYSARFQSPKIFYPHFSRSPSFSFDPKGFFGNYKTYCIPTEDNYLLGVLNSALTWYVVQGMCSPKRGGWYEMRVQYMETMPIVSASECAKGAIGEIAKQLSLDSVLDRLSLERELNQKVAVLYGLDEDEQAYMGKGQPVSPITIFSEDEE